jgi:hypothetical protein
MEIADVIEPHGHPARRQVSHVPAWHQQAVDLGT